MATAGMFNQSLLSTLVRVVDVGARNQVNTTSGSPQYGAPDATLLTGVDIKVNVTTPANGIDVVQFRPNVGASANNGAAISWVIADFFGFKVLSKSDGSAFAVAALTGTVAASAVGAGVWAECSDGVRRSNGTAWQTPSLS